jgi:hypothetical protein
MPARTGMRHTKKAHRSTWAQPLIRRTKFGVPMSVMRELSAARLPPKKRDYNLKLKELMGAIVKNGKDKRNGDA